MMMRTGCSLGFLALFLPAAVTVRTDAELDAAAVEVGLNPTKTHVCETWVGGEFTCGEEQVTLRKYISKGASGCVFEAKRKKQGEEVVVKVEKNPPKQEKNSFKN